MNLVKLVKLFVLETKGDNENKKSIVYVYDVNCH